MNWRYATLDDCPILGRMNFQLIQDERHSNPMNLAQLVDRMREFLHGTYTAVLFEDSSTVVGYALFHPQEDFLYLRQFFIEPARRRQGFGRLAIKHLFSDIFPPGQRIVVSVLATNPDAFHFWRAVGFRDYCLTLEMPPRVVSSA